MSYHLEGALTTKKGAHTFKMATYTLPETEQDSIPHLADYSALTPGALYTFTTSPIECDKVRGQEDADDLAQASEQGVVYVWISAGAREGATSPQALPFPARVSLQAVAA